MHSRQDEQNQSKTGKFSGIQGMARPDPDGIHQDREGGSQKQNANSPDYPRGGGGNPQHPKSAGAWKSPREQHAERDNVRAVFGPAGPFDVGAVPVGLW